MEKINKLKKLFNHYNLDGYIVPKNDEFFGEYIPQNKDKLKFISNFSGSYGLALILKNKNYLFVDGRYTLQAKIQSGKLFDIITIPHRFPSDIKAFYMKRDPENEKVVLGMDILAPEGYGEIVGGSERETDIDVLLHRIEQEKLNKEDYDWFLDLRKFGSVPHSGFGMGLERVVAWICGLSHIRETIPFARTMSRLNP